MNSALQTDQLYEKHVLGNGMKVLLIKRPSKTVFVDLNIDSGTFDEPEKKEGIFSVIENLLYNDGTEKFSAEELREIKSGLGNLISSKTSEESTDYFGTVSREDLGKFLEFLTQIAYHPRLETASIEKEKNMVYKEMIDNKNDPNFLGGILLLSNLYESHPLKRYGETENIKGITEEDVRSVYRQHYVPSNTTLVVSGDLPENVLEMIKGYFASEEPRELEKQARSQEKGLSKRKVVEKEMKDITSCILYLGFPTVGREHKDYYALSLASDILTGGFLTSRLYKKMREEKQLCYFVGSRNSAYSDVGHFVIKTELSLENKDEALRIIMDEIRKLKELPVDEEELAKYKKVRSFGVLETYETDEGSAKAAFFQERIGYSLEDAARRYNAVTPNDVMEVCRKYFDPNKYVLVVLKPVKN